MCWCLINVIQLMLGSYTIFKSNSKVLKRNTQLWGLLPLMFIYGSKLGPRSLDPAGIYRGVKTFWYHHKQHVLQDSFTAIETYMHSLSLRLRMNYDRPHNTEKSALYELAVCIVVAKKFRVLHIDSVNDDIKISDTIQACPTLSTKYQIRCPLPSSPLLTTVNPVKCYRQSRNSTNSRRLLHPRRVFQVCTEIYTWGHFAYHRILTKRRILGFITEDNKHRNNWQHKTSVCLLIYLKMLWVLRAEAVNQPTKYPAPPGASDFQVPFPKNNF